VVVSASIDIPQCDEFRKYTRLSHRTMSAEFWKFLSEEVANIMSVQQPDDQGIMKSLKHKYCSHLVCKFLQRIKTIRECHKISLFEAISILPAIGK
jgi:hypothetical protein